MKADARRTNPRDGRRARRSRRRVANSHTPGDALVVARRRAARVSHIYISLSRETLSRPRARPLSRDSLSLATRAQPRFRDSPSRPLGLARGGIVVVRATLGVVGLPLALLRLRLRRLRRQPRNLLLLPPRRCRGVLLPPRAGTRRCCPHVGRVRLSLLRPGMSVPSRRRVVSVRRRAGGIVRVPSLRRGVRRVRLNVPALRGDVRGLLHDVSLLHRHGHHHRPGGGSRGGVAASRRRRRLDLDGRAGHQSALVAGSYTQLTRPTTRG